MEKGKRKKEMKGGEEREREKKKGRERGKQEVGVDQSTHFIESSNTTK